MATPHVEFKLLDVEITNIDPNGRCRPGVDDFVPFMDDLVRLTRMSRTGPHPNTYTDSEAKY